MKSVSAACTFHFFLRSWWFEIRICMYHTAYHVVIVLASFTYFNLIKICRKEKERGFKRDVKSFLCEKPKCICLLVVFRSSYYYEFFFVTNEEKSMYSYASVMLMTFQIFKSTRTYAFSPIHHTTHNTTLKWIENVSIVWKANIICASIQKWMRNGLFCECFFTYFTYLCNMQRLSVYIHWERDGKCNIQFCQVTETKRLW